MAKGLIPKLTRATTAYHLLSRVCRLITEEPKRYDQSAWLNHYHQKRNWIPGCGTIGCVAGWVDVLVTNNAPRLRGLTGPTYYPDGISVEGIARTALGLDKRQSGELFSGSAISDTDKHDRAPGTPAYAALGVQHIRAFQKKYAAQLKATIVKPVTL